MAQLTLVTGAGGFIGGQLVRDLLAKGVPVRAVDKKPVDDWYFRSSHAENLVADLQLAESCDHGRQRVLPTSTILAADMGGMGFIENNKSPVHAVGADQHAYADCRAEARRRSLLLFVVRLRLSGYKQTDADVTALKEV